MYEHRCLRIADSGVFRCNCILYLMSKMIRHNNFRKLKSKQKKTWFAVLW